MVFEKGRKPWARRREADPRGAALAISFQRSCHGLRPSIERTGRPFDSSRNRQRPRCRMHSGSIRYPLSRRTGVAHL